MACGRFAGEQADAVAIRQLGATVPVLSNGQTFLTMAAQEALANTEFCPSPLRGDDRACRGSGGRGDDADPEADLPVIREIVPMERRQLAVLADPEHGQAW